MAGVGFDTPGSHQRIDKENTMTNIEIINGTSANTISINLADLTVTQIIRFPSGNFCKSTTSPFRTLEDARAWARFL